MAKMVLVHDAWHGACCTARPRQRCSEPKLRLRQRKYIGLRGAPRRGRSEQISRTTLALNTIEHHKR
jgi:hypothetical protein